MVKGVNEIKFSTIRGIAGGWVLTPVLSGLLSFFALFFVKNIFGLNVGSEVKSSIAVQEVPSGIIETLPETGRYINLIWPGISVLVLVVFAAVIIYSLNQQKRRLAVEKELLEKKRNTTIPRRHLPMQR
ncbi:MAG: hypothetical protein MZV63_62340 [Marinilabiliales bacterium]|nr:hypothetical protein [Marinilabiliales bacterium]